MRLRGTVWLTALALCAAACVVFAADTKDAKDAKVGEITLTGSAVWSKKTATITATLTPMEGKRNDYTVVWNFTWEGKNNTWNGRIQGNLKNGAVVGDGATPDGKRTFIFRATATNGVITGKHYETTGGKTKLTGDIGLKM